MEVFYGFGCNICYKTDDGSLKDISEENMKHVKDTLITFVGHADIIKHNEIYLCQFCCQELIRFDKFREMCFRHLIQFRQRCFNMLFKLELEGDKAAANNTLKPLVNEEVLPRNFLDRNNCPASISTVYNEVLKSSEELNKSDLVQVINLQSQRNECEFVGDCNTASVLNSFIKCDESPVTFTNEEDMKNIMISRSEDTKLETFDVSNVSDTSQIQFIKEEIDLNDEIKSSDSENYSLTSFENKSDEQANLDVKEPVVNNSSDSTKEELTVKQENSHSEGVKLERTEDEFGDDVHAAFEITNVYTIVNMEDADGGNEDIRNQEGKLGMKLGSTWRNNKSTIRILKTGPSSPRVQARRNGECPTSSNGDTPYKCTVCNKPFKQASSLSKHKCIHSVARAFKCTDCNKTFTRSSDLTKHKRIHSDDRPYKCTICNQTFTYSSVLVRHKRIHSGDRPYKCTICNQTFTYSSALAIHKRIHSGDRPYKCTICNQTFTGSSGLTKHKRKHSGDRPYKCTICNQTFTYPSALAVHKLIHSGDRPYKCTICNQTFTYSSVLARHKRTHSGDRPYKCTVCNKTFIQSSALAVHKRIHSGDRPYKCTICSQTFTDSSALAVHKRIHSGDRPYKCTICNQTFTYSSVLARHKRTHSGDKP